MRELRAAAKGANVVIIVLDSARADHFGCYGYPRETTPSFDRLAGESFLFERHFCPYPHTYASTASLLTGQYPDTHLGYGGIRLRPTVPTLPGMLSAAGYVTVGFSSNRWLAGYIGLGDRFDAFEYGRSSEGEKAGPMESLAPEALFTALSDWLEHRPKKPFFAYIHLLPPHIPYQAPREIQKLFEGKEPPGAWQGDYPFDDVEAWGREQRKQDAPPLKKWVNLYDANLRWADWAMGEIEQRLRRAGALEKSILILTSDHGEAFGEHGYTYHSFGVYDELVHIPLAIKLPGDHPPRRIDALTETVDLVPTILDLLGIAATGARVQGRSLTPLMSGDCESVHNLVFARAGGAPPSYLVRTKEMALILYQGARRRALYDLLADERQMSNIIRQAPEQAERLERAFMMFAQTQAKPPLEFADRNAKPPPRSGERIRLTEKDRRDLHALGYVD